MDVDTVLVSAGEAACIIGTEVKEIDGDIIKNVDYGTIAIGTDVYVDNLDVSIVYRGRETFSNNSVTFTSLRYIDTKNQFMPYICLNNVGLPDESWDIAPAWSGSIVANWNIAGGYFYIICNGSIVSKASSLTENYLFDISDKTIKFVSMKDTTEFSVYIECVKDIFNSGCMLLFVDPSYVSDLKVNGNETTVSTEISLDNVTSLSFSYNKNSGS